KARGFMPKLIITTEDKPKGRHLVLTAPEVKVWAEKEHIPYIQPKTLRDPDVAKTISSYFDKAPDVFIVAMYGKIIPDEILNMPTYKTLNVHPSLLPRLRGASPIKSAILSENETGTTIIRLDSEMDHGPILAQRKASFTEWPPYEEEADVVLATLGGKMLADILPDVLSEKIDEKEQNHNEATFCKKIEKEDAELNMSDPVELN